jgi:oligopeptide transport system substrate-binding protein
MKKKFFMLLMVFLLALGIVACGGDDQPVDTEKPVISGTRNFTYVIGVDAAPNFTQGVTAFDNLDGNITSKLTVNSTAVNLTVPGVYNVVYTVTDLSGNTQTVTVTVTVRDLAAPVISGVTNKTYTIGVSPAIDYLAGVTVSDNVDTLTVANLVVDSSAVSLTVPGVYTVTYTLTDSSLNVATRSIVVVVQKETVAPVISGVKSISYVIGDDAPNYLAGVTASDNVDGNLTSAIVVDSSSVDLEAVGAYTITYSVSDAAGNTTTVQATIQVKLHADDADLIPPVISGTQNYTYTIGISAPINFLAGVTAEDNEDGDVTDSIVVDSSAVNFAVAGIYQVFYTASDSYGNERTVSVTVVVNKETTPPVIEGTRNYSYTIGVSAPINFATGVTAMDNVDGDLTSAIVINSSAVSFTVPGVYAVTYTVTDAAGNVTTVSVNVTVVLETVPPVIGGVRVLEYYIGDAAPNYRLGLTVSDNVSVLTVADIVVNSSAVNLTVAGRYPVLFSVTDEAGNVGTASTEIVVAVNPIDLTPDLTATYRTFTSGTNNLNPYSETLATASELFGWVTDSLYSGDFDWAAAREILVNEGVTGLPAEIGFAQWYAAGKTAGQLPYNRYPQMAASLPQPMDTEGLVWQITLRNDLKFQDGTVINAATFDYGWRQLLDPKLLNDRASNLYSATDLPLVNAEGYFKQLTPDTDEYGFRIYAVGGVKYARANSYYGVTGEGYDIYTVEAKYANLVGPAGIKAYVEFWGSSYLAYGLNGWVLETQADEYFRIGTDNKLYAPTAGWTLDGVAVPHVLPVGVTYKAGGAGYAGAYPAYANAEGVLAAVDPVTGIPVGGVETYDDATVVTWAEVGFKVIGDFASSLTFEITLKEGRTAWDVMGALTSAITGVVHPAAYEAGMNASRTQTTYGTIDNPLVSYGPYNMTAWETDVLYFYTLNPNHYDAADYRITKVRYDVIADQSIAVSEFKAGRLDVVGAGGVYYNEFKFNKNLKLSPVTTFFRFAFNIRGSDAYALNPILVYPEFRQAFYFAIDRETFSSEVRAPSHPTYGFLGPVYLSTEYNFVSYRGSQPGQDVLADFSPETFGYNPTKAKELFDDAYALAVAAGDIQQGEVVQVEYKFFNVETNWQVANWVKDTVETIFNEGEATPLFSLKLTAVSSAALNQAWANGDFEMTFGGWQGLNFDAPSMLGQVYNSYFTYMLEKGFNTKDAQVVVELPNSKLALESWIAGYELLVAPTDTQTAQYNKWVALHALFVGDTLTTTYHQLFSYAYGELYNVKDVNYAGKTDDFDAITAALEGVLLDQMIAIPLFTSVAATVYSTRVVFESNEYHAWMAWGGFKYMYLGKPIV